MQSSSRTLTRTKLAHIERRAAATPEIIGFQSYEYLVNNAAALRAAFDADLSAASNPPLFYSCINIPSLEDLIAEAQAVLRELQQMPRSTRAKMLRKAIEARLLELHLLQLGAMLQEDDLTAEERIEAQDWFRAANELIYGTPQIELFATIADRRIFNLLATPIPAGSDASRLQKELKRLVGRRPPVRTTRRRLFQVGDISEQAAAIIRQRFAPLVDHIQVAKEYTLPDIIAALEHALAKIGAGQRGWRVEQVVGRSHLAVSAHRKVVEVGEDRDPMCGDELQAKIVHEIGVHTLRSINAEKSGWISAAYGQQGYLDFEEAFAHLCGAVFWDAGGDRANDEYRYLIAGFAYGLDGKQPRDFRGNFEITWRAMAIAVANQHGEISAESLSRVRKNAYKQTVRMFRGTPGNVPGLLYLKDLAYIHGKENVGKVLPLLSAPEDMDLLLAGKLDISRPDHLKVARMVAPGTPLSGALFATQSI